MSDTKALIKYVRDRLNYGPNITFGKPTVRDLVDALEQAERLRVHDSRFWRHVDDSGDCWEWKGTKDRKGYGQFTVNKKHFLHTDGLTRRLLAQ